MNPLFASAGILSVPSNLPEWGKNNPLLPFMKLSHIEKEAPSSAITRQPNGQGS
jgi:hypothetical protein